MNATLTTIEALHIYAVSDVPMVHTDSSRPLAIRPDQVVIRVEDGQVRFVSAVGVTVRKNGTDGARRGVHWGLRYDTMPDWVAAVVELTGLPVVEAARR